MISIKKLRERVLDCVSDGGFQSVMELVNLIPPAKLRKHYDFLDEEE